MAKSSKLFFFWGKSAVWCFGIKNHFVRRIKREKRKKHFQANGKHRKFVACDYKHFFSFFSLSGSNYNLSHDLCYSWESFLAKKFSCTNWQNDPRDKSGYEIHFICKNNFSGGKNFLTQMMKIYAFSISVSVEVNCFWNINNCTIMWTSGWASTVSLFCAYKLYKFNVAVLFCVVVDNKEKTVKKLISEIFKRNLSQVTEKKVNEEINSRNAKKSFNLFINLICFSLRQFRPGQNGKKAEHKFRSR